jgi:hypothetical protein
MGQLLVTLTVPSHGSVNTGNSIPNGCAGVIAVLDSEAAGYNFRTGTGNVIALSTDFSQLGPASLQIPLVTGTGQVQTVAFYNGGAGGTVKVYAACDGKVQD